MVIVIWCYIHLFPYPALSSNSNSSFCTPMSLSERAPEDKNSCPCSLSTPSLLCRINSPLCSLSICLSLNSRVNSSFLRMCDPYMQYSRQGLVQTLCAGNDVSFYFIWGKSMPSLGHCCLLVTGPKRVAVLTSSQPPVCTTSSWHCLQCPNVGFLTIFHSISAASWGRKKIKIKKKLSDSASDTDQISKSVSMANEINKILAFWVIKEMSLCP